MNSEERWNEERPVSDFGIDVPAWIESDIGPSTVEAICQGGCESGAYMPAVTYYTARQTMNEHGDDVIAYLDDRGLSLAFADQSWSQLACSYLSAAVETWAYAAQEELEAYEAA